MFKFFHFFQLKEKFKFYLTKMSSTYEELQRKGYKPKKPIVFANPDKEGLDDKWKPDSRNPMCLPSVCRMIVCGKAGSGKTSLVKSILLNKDFKRVYVVSGLPPVNAKREWGSVKNVRISSNVMPPVEKLTKGPQRCIIFDDLDIKSMSEEDLNLMNNVYRSLSSHAPGLFACTIVHNFTNVPRDVRVNANYFTVFK